MKENQCIEWKESWRDEYLKWISGFANAEGGLLVIGRNDRGIAVGIPNARKLLEDLPHKIRDVLGIMVDVNLTIEDDRELIEIQVEPFPYPVSYKGEYHLRSGSTKQELKGAALDRWIYPMVALMRSSVSLRFSLSRIWKALWPSCGGC